MSNVLVTGSGGGLGRVIAETFYSEGHKVHICDIDADVLAQTLGDNPGMQGTVTDLGDKEQIEAMFREIRNRMGEVEVLVNNVGIAGPRAPIEEMPEEEWQRTIDVNVNSCYRCLKEVLPGMKAQKNGVIVNITTVSTKTFPTNRSIYNMTKYALEGLTLSVAKETGPFNIRCNAIRPGMINNERQQRIAKQGAAELGIKVQEFMQRKTNYISMHTMVEMKEIADLLIFLASDTGRHITGQIIAVDGNYEYEM